MVITCEPEHSSFLGCLLAYAAGKSSLSTPQGIAQGAGLYQSEISPRRGLFSLDPSDEIENAELNHDSNRLYTSLSS